MAMGTGPESGVDSAHFQNSLLSEDAAPPHRMFVTSRHIAQGSPDVDLDPEVLEDTGFHDQPSDPVFVEGGVPLEGTLEPGWGEPSPRLVERGGGFGGTDPALYAGYGHFPQGSPLGATEELG